MKKLKSWGYPPVKTHDPSLSRFETVPACDRPTGRRTNYMTPTCTCSTAPCIASYADAL